MLGRLRTLVVSVVLAVATVAAACTCTCNDTCAAADAPRSPAPRSPAPRSPAPRSPPPPRPSVPKFFAPILDRHNEARARHGVPPLAWSTEVAESADAWNQVCLFEHERQRRYGENLYAVWGEPDATKALTGAVRAWYGEEPEYDYKAARFTPRTGHFTQVVWKNSKFLGCSVRPCNAMLLVNCRYSPPGNVLGDFDDNVFPPKKDADKKKAG